MNDVSEILSPDLLAQVSVGAAFLAGLLSALSPSVFFLLPFMAALTAGLARANLSWPEFLQRMVLFSGAFTGLFVCSWAAGSDLGQWFLNNQRTTGSVAGGLIILAGISFLADGFFPTLPWAPHRGLAGLLFCALLGAALALVWTPTDGPVFGALTLLASVPQQMQVGLRGLSIFCAGLSIIMVLMASLFHLIPWGASLAPARAAGFLYIVGGSLAALGLWAKAHMWLLQKCSFWVEWLSSKGI